jgi:hypothetical protein
MAAEELGQSAKFGQLLKIILELGAVLNEGTYLKSHGFKLNSLLKVPFLYSIITYICSIMIYMHTFYTS